ncbi:SLC13 family permease [Bacillus alveayuensis]|jgi:solute carrier family 13 (sodium-dependent dicarboxylate transporter), member 2/3/5|uniref:SLC13 family permease n=1 Tax=Aeribacillus alveayuensis TaxID=279215 RepID=UPI000B078B53|nr:DASS family sodium-coupled anion symporter [Bacillus alveayuensis]
MKQSMLTKFSQTIWNDHVQLKQMFAQFLPTSTIETDKKGSTPLQPNPLNSYSGRQKVGLILGPLLFFLILNFFHPEGMSKEALAVLASTTWIAIWWITEAIPIPATSLLPIILFPLTGALDVGTTTSSYGNDVIFLFMGGFLIALTMERWNLHKRIALSIISMIGTNMERLVFGFMLATAFLSMWISNTATAMMMVPIGTAIVYKVKEAVSKENLASKTNDAETFAKALMLGIAYSASIGGLGTLIGTPPNALFAAVAGELFDVTISFSTWMLFGVPIAALLLIGSWYYLTKIAFKMKLKNFPGGKEVIQSELKSLGKLSFEEKIIFTVFLFTSIAWISRSFILSKWIPGINDTIIALIGAVILFAIPSKNKPGAFLLDWETVKKLPWGILLLFGGGLAIAAGFKETGLAQWIGEKMTLVSGIHFILILVVVTTIVIFLTEITSNTATATMILPIMASLASAIGVHPYALMVASAIAASCAFMLPVATPPNAVVFGSNYLKIGDMARAGFWLNVVSIIVIAFLIYLWMPIVWGIDIQHYPADFK